MALRGTPHGAGSWPLLAFSSQLHTQKKESICAPGPTLRSLGLAGVWASPDQTLWPEFIHSHTWLPKEMHHSVSSSWCEHPSGFPTPRLCRPIRGHGLLTAIKREKPRMAEAATLEWFHSQLF